MIQQNNTPVKLHSQFTCLLIQNSFSNVCQFTWRRNHFHRACQTLLSFPRGHENKFPLRMPQFCTILPILWTSTTRYTVRIEIFVENCDLEPSPSCIEIQHLWNAWQLLFKLPVNSTLHLQCVMKIKKPSNRIIPYFMLVATIHYPELQYTRSAVVNFPKCFLKSGELESEVLVTDND